MATKRTNEEQTCTLILRICRLLNSRSITIKGCNVMYFKKKLKVRKKRHICKLSEFTVILHYRVIFQLKICFFNATTCRRKAKASVSSLILLCPKKEQLRFQSLSRLHASTFLEHYIIQYYIISN